ncbi:TetR/AcrR family transcriptional regulator [Pseudomonas sp. N-137]|uniref:TetR/AcrR family transcriptional regulator n=1 Tax=Pseudomonas sp. N-137 TaxID=3108452 RepID=UPI002ADEB601|nr:TetR/AcrR family transcriptional regulator [Pseudomonas sp. N-137]MEA1028057.1 TetR/AcrR family transcriptional regulator [Pseudomonas sp. N-137]
MNNKVDEIKRHAVRLIAEKGFEAMSLRQLAAAVGVCPGSVYAHYESKGQLLQELYCDYLKDLMFVWVDQRKQDREKQSAEQMLMRFVAVYVGFYYRKAAESLIVQLDFRSLDDQGKAMVNELTELYEAELGSILRQGMLDGVFQFCDLLSVQLAILCVLRGFCAAGCSAAPMPESWTIEACVANAFRLAGVQQQCDPISQHRVRTVSCKVRPSLSTIKS